MKQILETVARQLTEFFDIDQIVIYRFEPSGTKLILELSQGFSEESTKNLSELKGDHGILERLIETRIPQVVNDIPQTQEDLSFLTENDGVFSMIAVPLFSGEESWGILVAFSRLPFSFSREDAKIINLFAGQLGECIELFSRSLRENLDELLVQLLGSIELIGLKFRDKPTIKLSDVLAEQERLKRRVLALVNGKEEWLVTEPSDRKGKPKEKMVLPSGDELDVEEVITIKGEKKSTHNSKKVLVIDDQPLITDLLVSVLERMGYHPQVASSGTAGLELFNKDGFDLVITDLGMPDVSGWDVSKLVKAKKPHVPVVVITGWGVDPDPNKVTESGVDLIIYKPFQINELERTIRDLLKK
jgi:CheY-like chemotaxis protein/putative methionine-R-sulfoxide reductase with GAF domain